MGVFADLLQNVGEAGRRLAPGLAAMGSNASTVGRNIAVADQQYRQFEAEDKQRQMADALANLDDYSYSTLADTLMQYDPKLALAYKGKAYEQQKADELRRATVGNILGFMQKEGINTSGISPNSDPEILKAVLNSHLDARNEQAKIKAETEAAKDKYGAYRDALTAVEKYRIDHRPPTVNSSVIKGEQAYLQSLQEFQNAFNIYKANKAGLEKAINDPATSPQDREEAKQMLLRLRPPVPPIKPSFLGGTTPSVQTPVAPQTPIQQIMAPPQRVAPAQPKPEPVATPTPPPAPVVSKPQAQPQPEQTTPQVKPNAAPMSGDEITAAALGFPETPDVNTGGVDIPNPASILAKKVAATKIANLATHLLNTGRAATGEEARQKASQLLGY